MAQTIHEKLAVWQVGEQVVEHPVLELLLQGLALGDVGLDAQPMEWVSSLVMYDGCLVQEPSAARALKRTGGEIPGFFEASAEDFWTSARSSRWTWWTGSVPTSSCGR